MEGGREGGRWMVGGRGVFQRLVLVDALDCKGCALAVGFDPVLDFLGSGPAKTTVSVPGAAGAHHPLQGLDVAVSSCIVAGPLIQCGTAGSGSASTSRPGCSLLSRQLTDDVVRQLRPGAPAWEDSDRRGWLVVASSSSRARFLPPAQSGYELCSSSWLTR